MDANLSRGGSKQRRTGRQQIAAAATRQEILTAARSLFAERGYARTSMADIANAAGVSIPTIYASVGQKPAIVMALVGLVDSAIGGEASRERLVSEAGAGALIRLAVQVTRRVEEHFGDISAVLRSAAESEPELAEAQQGTTGHHRAATDAIARRLDGMGALKPGLSAKAAAGILYVITSPEAFRKLHRELGWSYDEAERRLAAAAAGAVLRE